MYASTKKGIQSLEAFTLKLNLAITRSADARVLGCGQRLLFRLKTAVRPAYVVFVRFGALTPCIGHGLDHCCRRSQHCGNVDNNKIAILSRRAAAPCYNLLQTPPLRGLGSGSWSTRMFAGPGFRDAVVRSLYVAVFPCYNMASGCPCLEMRATPFVYRAATRKLVPVAALRFGALTPCYGHGLDHRRRQSHHRSGKRNNLNSQFHGQITSFRKRRRYQHTGLTPLTASHCITVTRTYVPYFGNSSVERRAA